MHAARPSRPRASEVLLGRYCVRRRQQVRNADGPHLGAQHKFRWTALVKKHFTVPEKHFQNIQLKILKMEDRSHHSAMRTDRGSSGSFRSENLLSFFDKKNDGGPPDARGKVKSDFKRYLRSAPTLWNARCQRRTTTNDNTRHRKRRQRTTTSDSERRQTTTTTMTTTSTTTTTTTDNEQRR